MTARRIVALGGGGFSEGSPSKLDEYILSLCGSDKPRICFLPTASGDSEDYIKRFYAAFENSCDASHLSLFESEGRDARSRLLEQDVVYVGGGNTANMLAVWRLHGVDRSLREAYERGVVLCGVSAGANCWFQSSVTDSFGPDLEALDDGLGLLKGSFCPHYDGEDKRKPRYEEFIKTEALAAGYAADDNVGIYFLNGELREVVSDVENKGAYRLDTETPTEPETLAIRLL